MSEKVQWVRKIFTNTNFYEITNILMSVLMLRMLVKPHAIGMISRDCKYVNSAYGFFEEKLMALIDKHSPLKKQRIRKQESPWMNSDIIELIRKRNLSKKHAIKSKLDGDWREYRGLRNQVTAKIRRAKADFITKSVKLSNGNSQQVWKSLKTLMPSKNDKGEIICMESENGVTRNKQDIANNFNTFFVKYRFINSTTDDSE